MVKKITKSKYKLSKKEGKACHTIIHTASGSAAAVGAGLAQLPLADNVVITPIQITMIISLGKVFEQEITKTVAKGLLGGFIANFVGRGAAQAAWGWIPGIGNASNAVTAAIITESVGWLCVDHFYKEKYLCGFSNEKQETSEQNEKESQIRTEEIDEKIKLLKIRAMSFINGEKNLKDNKQEYFEIHDDISEMLNEVSSEDELYEIFEKFQKLISRRG